MGRTAASDAGGALTPLASRGGSCEASPGPLSALASHLDRARRSVLPGGRRRRRGAALAAMTATAAADAKAGTPSPASGEKPASDVLAGALARAASQSTIHPIDTIKVRMQSGSSAGSSKVPQLVTPPLAGAGVRDALGRALPRVASLYSGVVGAASGAGIAIGAYFACYGAAHNALSRAFSSAPAWAVAFVAGAAAAAGSSFVKVPIAVCIRSVQAGRYPSAGHAASSILRAVGPRGLFTGFVPTLLEDIPDMAFKFAAYESLRQLHRRVKGRQASPQEDFAMGAVAGAFAAAATTPLDVVKTNMMVNASQRPGMVQAAANVWSQGGAGAFLRGIGPRAISNGINSAVFFCFFEALSRTLQDVTARAAAEDLNAVAASGANATAAATATRVSAGREARGRRGKEGAEGEGLVLSAQPASISVAGRMARPSEGDALN